MLAVSLKDISGVKYAEDFIKLSVAQSKHIFPTEVSSRVPRRLVVGAAVKVLMIISFDLIFTP